MRILLTADPEIPVPPVGYGGIERIVDALAREFTVRGHPVGLMAHGESRCPVPQRFAWPLFASSLLAGRVQSQAGFR